MRLGKYGEVLYRYARGIDEREVRTDWQRKSLSSERTYSQDLEGLAVMDAEIDRLSAGVAESLAERGLEGTTVVLKVRYGDFTTVTRSRTLECPVTEATQLARVGRELLRKTEASERPVRLLGIGVSRFNGDDGPQLRLF